MRYILSLLLISVFATATASGNGLADNAAPIIDRIHIQIHPDTEDTTKWMKMAGALMVFKPNDRFSSLRLEASIDALKQCKQFRKIHIEEKKAGDRIVLEYHLTPFRCIKDIKISGEYPLFERDILRVMTVFVGDVYDETVLAKQGPRIEELFQKDGFISPQVKIRTRQDPKDKNHIINVRIDKGDYYVLKKLDITGTRGIPKRRIKSFFDTWWISLIPGSAGRYSENRFKKDIETLVEFYRFRNFVEATVEYSVEKNQEEKTLSIHIKIDEGPRYKVRFAGNKKFKWFTLKKDMVIFQQGNKNDMGLKRSIKKIRQRYCDAGYLESRVKIESRLTQDDKGAFRDVRLVIDEGPRTQVAAIHIEGNKKIQKKRIKKNILTGTSGVFRSRIFVPEILEKDLLAVKSLYIKQGFMDAQISETLTWSPDRKNVSVKLNIDEGKRSIVQSVTLSGLTTVSLDEAVGAISLTKGKPFRMYMVQSDENTLSALVSKNGYPHVQVRSDLLFNDNKTKADITYHVDEGRHVTMGDVFFTGNLKTKEKNLKKELGVISQEPFSAQRLILGQKDIRDMDIFKTVRFQTIGLKEKAKKVNLIVEVEEKKPYFIQAGAGYKTETGFFANGKTGDNNLFGKNKRIWLSGETSEIGYRGEVGLTEPRLLYSKISASLVGFVEREAEFNKAFETLTTGSSLGFSRKLTVKSVVGLNFRYEHKRKYEKELLQGAWAVEEGQEFEKRRIIVATPSIVYDGRDSFVLPKNGRFFSAYIDISEGIEDDQDNFYKVRVDFRLFFTPFERLTFAWLSRLGYIEDIKTGNKIPDDQLFYLGGASDVRGFDESMLRSSPDDNPIGGLKSIVESVEARLRVMRNIELALFFDMGCISDIYLEQETIDDTMEFRFSAGVGLRYITPVGPIGLCYGYKLDRKPDESAGRLHFSIGYTF